MRTSAMTHVDAPSDFDGDQAEYQTLTPLAALALALGVLSLSAFAAPLLLIVPAAAIGVALLALGKIRASGGALSGARLARSGLALALRLRHRGVRPRSGAQCSHAGRATRSPNSGSRFWPRVSSRTPPSCSTREALQGMVPRPGEGEKPITPEEGMAIAIGHLRHDNLVERLTALGAPIRISSDDPAEQPVFDGARTLLGVRRTVTGADAGDSFQLDLAYVRIPFYETEGRPWRIERWKVVEEPPSGGSEPSALTAR